MFLISYLLTRVRVLGYSLWAWPACNRYFKFSILHLWSAHGFRTRGEALFIALLIIVLVDSLLVDDEPIFEPIEWSLWQTWLLFIFGFAWAGENLIVSRYGSYTGRDRRVWYSWYKSFWLVDGYFIICLGAAALFVIVPFYYEITYKVAFVYQWWHSYTAIYWWTQSLWGFIIILILHVSHVSLHFFSWKVFFFLQICLLLIISYIHFWQWISGLWAFFNDEMWYRASRTTDLIQFSHEPLHWNWGSARRDHFTYHRTPTIFWYRTDGAYAGALLLFTLMQAWTLFFVLLFLLITLRIVWTTHFTSYTYYTYTSTAIRQYFYLLSLTGILMLFSLISIYWTAAPEFYFYLNKFTPTPLAAHISHLRFVFICYLLRRLKF